MTKPEAHLLDWLRDAHAMEIQAEKMLQVFFRAPHSFGRIAIEQGQEATRRCALAKPIPSSSLQPMESSGK